MVNARVPVVIALGLLCLAVASIAEVSIEMQDKDHHIQTGQYEAVVGHDGCFTSLRVGDAEFLQSAESFPRGAYMYQGTILRLPEVAQPAENVVTAESEKAAVRYEFGEASMTWTLTNKTDKQMLLVLVFGLDVKAMMDGSGRFWKAPLKERLETSTWFQGKAKVCLEGGTRVWGPWGAGHQIWQADLAGKETREVRVTVGAATDDEAAQAEEAANRVIVPPEDPTGPMWDMEKFSEAPSTFPAEGFSEEGVKALFFEGPPYWGQATRVFAWLGLPDMKPGEKVPGMVLVHGGGGTAFAEWVRLWTGRGYAAIAMDTCGCTPGGGHAQRPRHKDGGPEGGGGWGQIDWPREDQWTYHAVASAILANSLLRSLPEVDPERIGVTGISWGGYLTSILAGVDPRFKLAVPVYGCGYYLDTLFGASVRNLGDEKTDRWMRWWDPSVYLKDAKMPMLWVTGSNDFAYWFPALQQSYRATQGSRALCIRLRMPHGHGGPGENPEEIHAFADSILKGDKPLAKVTSQGREGDEVWVTFKSDAPIVKAELNFTKDTGRWPERKWEFIPAAMDQPGKATATLPEGTTVYYFNLTDERGLLVSSEHVELSE